MVDQIELDQLIDRSMQAPLRALEGEKQKTAGHAMAERLLGKRDNEDFNARFGSRLTDARRGGGSSVRTPLLGLISVGLAIQVGPTLQRSKRSYYL